MSSKYPKKEIILNDKVEVIWDDIIEMSDGTQLRCDIFKPNDKAIATVVVIRIIDSFCNMFFFKVNLYNCN